MDKLTRRGLVQAGIGGIAVASQTGAVLAQAPAQQPGALTTAPTSQAGMSPRLTLHAIDIFHGTPAAGMKVDLSRLDADRFKPMKSVETAPNGARRSRFSSTTRSSPGATRRFSISRTISGSTTSSCRRRTF